MRKFYLFAVLVLIGLQLNANNIQVTSATCTGQVPGSYTGVKFNLSWENSWRMSAGPSNWDAAWVFVKYKVSGGNWLHATLSATAGDHNMGTGGPSGGMSCTPATNGKGVFIYRSADGTGNISLSDVILRWNYFGDGVADAATLQVQVFAIEMVYIPQGPFFVGDGNVALSPSSSGFKINQAGGNNMPYKVTSEGSAITVCSSTYTGVDQMYDPLKTAGTSIAASFPKGYQAFYMMKYEVSQKQYVDFFNSLPKSSTILTNRNLTYVNYQYRNEFYWSTQVNEDAYIKPIGHSGDRAQNNMSFADACAYADWACLRPMTELEYEKASRGCDAGTTPIFPTNLEYAWGNTTLSTFTGNPATVIANDGLTNEGFSTPTSVSYNCHCNYYGWQNYVGPYTEGPLRCGIFGAKGWTSNQRTQSGASYYGVMELSGNVREIVMAITNYNGANTAKFDGQNGDGVLDATTGNANTPNWAINSSSTSQPMVVYPTTYYAVGLRGGSYIDYTSSNLTSAPYCMTSNRTYISSFDFGRNHPTGFRAVRVP